MLESLLNKITEGDCLDVMKDIPDNSVDLVLTDPPYELDDQIAGKSSIKTLQKYEDKKYLELCHGFDYDNVFKEWKRILKKVNMFVFCSNKQVIRYLNYWKEYQTTILIWHKVNSAPFANGTWRPDIEFCIHIREKGSTFQGGAVIKKKVKSFPTVITKWHPTEKPIDLIMDYMKIGSNEKDIIFDGFSGSGTTAIACHKLKRDFICIEKDADYVKQSRRRLKEEQAQLSLF